MASGLELGGFLGDWRGRRGKMVTGGREPRVLVLDLVG